MARGVLGQEGATATRGKSPAGFGRARQVPGGAVMGHNSRRRVHQRRLPGSGKGKGIAASIHLPDASLMSRVVLDERLWLAGSRWPSMSPDEHRRDRASWK